MLDDDNVRNKNSVATIHELSLWELSLQELLEQTVIEHNSLQNVYSILRH